jgi:multiple sugar transport system substrate-binding protein
MKGTSVRHFGGFSALALTAVVVAGCAPASAGGGGSDALTQEEIDAAMQEPTSLTYWSWLNKEVLDKVVAEFEAEYPAIDVTVENPGGAGQQSQVLRTAIQAGSGVPDAAQLSGDLAAFVLSEDLLDLTPYGAAELEDTFIDAAWDMVTIGDGIYGIPQDMGPVGVMYRHDLLQAAGIESFPTTWEEFADVAEQYRSATGQYLTNVSSLEIQIMSTQVGEQWFEWSGGEELTFGIDTPEHREVLEYLQDLIDRDLISVDAEFNDSFFQGMVSGKYASWIIPAWGPTFLQGVAASTAGNWSVARLPQWENGEKRNPLRGGSQVAVPAATEHPIQAAVFAQWMNSNPAATAILTYELALFPATHHQLNDKEWVNYEDPFFGGQKSNALWAEIATDSTATTDSPLGAFVVQATTDTIAPAVATKSSLVDAYANYQSVLAEYAVSQGFTVIER